MATERTTVQYDVYKNSLTIPPTFYPKVNPRATLNLAYICQEINKSVESYPVDVIKAILETFILVVKEEVSSGNKCKLEGFASFRPKLSGSMATSDASLPTNAFSIEIVPATPLQTELRQMASLERLSIRVKTPEVASAFDSSTNILNHVRNGYGFVINGSNLGWDQSDAELGVFMTSSAGTLQQTSVAFNQPSKAIVVPALSGIAPPNVEWELSVKNRYTENGQVRTGTYTTKIRAENVVSDGTTDEVFAIGAAAGPATLDYTGAQVDCQIELAVNPSTGALKGRIGDIAGTFGPYVEISEIAAYTLTGLASDVTLNVNDYDTLLANVKSYGNYMKEVCDLSPLTP